MNFETLKKSHKKQIIVGAIVCCLLISAIVFVTTRANYKTTQSINIVKGTINYKPYDFKIMAMYQSDDGTNYTEIDKMPESGYTINESKSYCTLDGTNKDTSVVLKTINGNHTISGLSTGDKCYLYFDPAGQTASTILAGLTKGNRGSITGPLTTDTTGTVYSTTDDDGTSYYYAGAVSNNWVKFAGFYWRIVRFNGNGSIRLIYNGTSTTTTGTGTQTQTSAFNSSYNDNMYVGYKYASGNVHGTTTDSTIKGVLDTWYNNNLKSYASKIDTNSGFCNDREPSTSNSTSNGSGGTSTTTTYYGAYIRFIPGGSWASTQVPTLKCKNISTDYFTVSGASKGNKALTNPIGLITADEVVFGGGFGGQNNTSYYLYTNQAYWTMSPSFFYSGNNCAYVFLVDSNGYLSGNYSATNTRGVRPVINLKADTLFATGGNGTASNPYVVQ